MSIKTFITFVFGISHMKITFITPFFYPVMGGVENHVYYLAKELIKKGHEVEVFTSDLERNSKLSNKEEVYDEIKITRFKTLFRIGDFGSFFPGMFKAIKVSDSDIFHFHVYRHPLNFGVLFTKKPCLLTPHWPNYPKELRKFYVNILIKVFDKLLGKFILKKFDKILSITDLETYWFKDKFNLPADKFELLPNGIPSSYLKKRNPSKFRKKIKIKDELMVLCLSRIHQSKGFDQVVKIAKFFPKVKFVIAGVDAGFKSELELIVFNDKLKNVIFAGKLTEEEKLEAYSSCDIFIHPSHYEGFGIVVLEAFSQETCVLTSNQGGLPWVVSDAGLTFEDNNLEDLKEKITLLLKDKKLREKLATQGRARVKDFTWEVNGEKLEGIYKK